MTVEEISKRARNGLSFDDMTCPERCLYYSLQDIYKRFSMGAIDKAKGEELKGKAVRQYKKDVDDMERSKHILKLHAEMWQNIESAGDEYRRSPTIENADKFLEAVYGCGRKQ